MAEPTGAGAAAPFNFKQAIAQMIQRSGSDLLLKVGRAPTVRVNGELADRLDLVGDGAERERQRAPLLVDVGAEPPHARHPDGEVRLFLLGELLDLARRHHLLGQQLEVLGL